MSKLICASAIDGAVDWVAQAENRLDKAIAAAERALALEDLVPVGRLGAQAVVSRVLHRHRRDAALGRFEPVAEGPGLARAISQAVHELRHAGIDASALDKEEPTLRALVEDYEVELGRAGIVDRARVFTLAAANAQFD